MEVKSCFVALHSAYLVLSCVFNHVKINILPLSDTYLLNFQKQRTLSSEKDAIKDHQLREYIEKQNAYFKEIDEFELEVESGDD